MRTISVTTFYILTAIILICFSSCSQSTRGRLDNIPDIDPSSYTLLWSDEFASDGGFDTTRWSYSPRGKVAWNKFLTHSTSYVWQKDDNLHLRMDNAVIEGDDVPYHSGGIQTQGKFSLRYGKVEVRAKFNRGRGAWPAIWMMPEPDHSLGNWPAGGEIDIMEHVSLENVVHQTIHNSAVTDANGGSTATSQSPYDPDGYNTYSIVWSPNAIAFYVNDVLRYTYRKPADATPAQWPFDVPFYIILNQSGGAGWPGPITDEDLPFNMAVDYVRVYDLPATERANIAPFVPVKRKKVKTIKMKPAAVNNPSLESNSLYPWNAWGNIAITENSVRTGKYAVRAWDGEAALEQEITGLNPNTTYRFGGFAKVAGPNTKVLLGVKDFGSEAVNTAVTSTEFTDVSVTFTTGATQTSAVVYFYKLDGGEAFGDDFYLRKQ